MNMNNETALTALLTAAEAIAWETYDCDLTCLDPSDIERYAARLTEANFDQSAEDLAWIAWYNA
jgi:hypothetical protein